MKFSENWLRQRVKTTATRDGLAAALTAIGLEVEMSVLGEALDGVVVARIVAAEKHPEADKLGLPGRCRQRHSAADRVRRTECARAWSRRSPPSVPTGVG